MATILQTLRGVNAYPIPLSALESVAVSRGLSLEAEFSAETAVDPSFRLALSDLYVWLSEAPNVSQGGQSYSFTDAQRDDLRDRARELRRGLEDDNLPGVTYGFKGHLL